MKLWQPKEGEWCWFYTFESKGSDDSVSGGNAVWNSMSLGRVIFD